MKKILILLLAVLIVDTAYAETIREKLRRAREQEVLLEQNNKIEKEVTETELKEETQTPEEIQTPEQIDPSEGAVFADFPRIITFRWGQVKGADSYSLEIDCYECCKEKSWCADLNRTYGVVTGIKNTSIKHKFVGAQPGRWRVWAESDDGRRSAKSGWRKFECKR